MGGTAIADVPGVAVDIVATHSLVTREMKGADAPSLIVQPGASLHECSLRPSEATRLQGADLVPWMGEDLIPWMADAVKTLAGNAAITTLPETEGTARFARQCQSIPDGWTNATDRPRPQFTKTLSRAARPESEVSA